MTKADPGVSAGPTAPPPLASEGFSLVLGGPLYQLYLRTRLAQPSMELLYRREMTCAVVTWLPLAALTAIGGTFLSGVRVPFVYDIEAHVRFLIAAPILIGAELIVHRRVRALVAQFRERGLIAPDVQPSFEAAIDGVMRLRNSIAVELSMLVLAFVGGYWLWRTQLTLDVATWYATAADVGAQLTWAGHWYAFVSLPIVRFLILRWYFRVFLWYLFVFRVSRLPLRLNALHPDRAGGLGFLSGSVDAFTPILVAQTAFLSGFIANQIFHAGATLPGFKLEILGFVAFLMLLVLLPLTFFVPQLAQAKRTALREFGLLAARYTREFRRKWLDPPADPDEPLLGSADIQSLGDLANAYDVVRGMSLAPIGRAMLLRLAIVIALPLAPLSLTLIPLEELVDRVFRTLL